jgi:hypothetical protein
MHSHAFRNTISSAVLALLGFCAAPPSQAAPTVLLGTDYFQTVGEAVDSLPGIGPVTFVGNRIGPGSTDTIVQRLEDADLSSGMDTIPIQMTALSLKTKKHEPVAVGGSFFDVFVTLDPNHLADSVGDMTILGDVTGGTWESNLAVFFQAHFQERGGGLTFDVFDVLRLSSTGGTWGPTPPFGAVIVEGPVGDQAANQHFGLSPDQTDFWNGVNVVHQGPHPVNHTIPEASSLAPIVTLGLILTCFVRRHKKAAQVASRPNV